MVPVRKVVELKVVAEGVVMRVMRVVVVGVVANEKVYFGPGPQSCH